MAANLNKQNNGHVYLTHINQDNRRMRGSFSSGPGWVDWAVSDGVAWLSIRGVVTGRCLPVIHAQLAAAFVGTPVACIIDTRGAALAITAADTAAFVAHRHSDYILHGPWGWLLPKGVHDEALDAVRCANELEMGRGVTRRLFGTDRAGDAQAWAAEEAAMTARSLARGALPANWVVTAPPLALSPFSEAKLLSVT